MAPAENIADVYNAIHAMFVLQNICIDIEDRPEDIPMGDDEDDELNIELSQFDDSMLEEAEAEVQWESNEELKQAGYVKRLQLLNDLFPI